LWYCGAIEAVLKLFHLTLNTNIIYKQMLAAASHIDVKFFFAKDF